MHAHGNGRFLYQPNLSDRSTDFTDGVYDSSNVQPGADGLTLKEAGQGYAIFEVRSPYIIVPRVGKLDVTDDDADASVVKVDGAGVSLAVSVDNGLTWSDVPTPKLAAGGQETIDLTPHVSGGYGYLLRLALQGEPGKAVLRGLEMTTWVQVAPASLPGLRQGKNVMEYRTGDHFGQPSRVVEIRTNGNDRADFINLRKKSSLW